MKRRKFFKRLFGTGLVAALYTWQVEPFWLEFVRIKMPIKNLPKELVGKTLMQISDMHIGDRFNYNFIIDALTTVFQHVVTGNLGTIGVLGNHDYGKNWKESEVANKVVHILQAAGVPILRNEQKEINGLTIIGIDDYWGTNFQPHKVLNQHNPDASNLVLCHNPDVLDEPIWNNYKGWILSGHTHGGQVKPPFLDAPMLPVKNKKYSQGKIDLEDGRIVYINRALGNLWQVRFNVRPEITVFELEESV
jgi:uncharacterized protein